MQPVPRRGASGTGPATQEAAISGVPAPIGQRGWHRPQSRPLQRDACAERHAGHESGYDRGVTEVVPIRSDRLELPLLTREQLRELLDGSAAGVAQQIDARIPMAWVRDYRRLIDLRLRQLDEHPDDEPWLLRPIIATDGDERRVVGGINFHGAPDERATPEVGYGLLADERGKGYAIEAVQALFDWARLEHGIRRFRASVAPDNERSLHLIGKLGFHQVGEQWDPDDGLELVFELDA